MSLTVKAQNKRFEIGLDVGLMKVKSSGYVYPNQKLNTRMGGNVGYRFSDHYTFRLGLYNENWDYRYIGKNCTIDPMTQFKICYDNNINNQDNCFTIPLISEFYVWKRRIKLIAAPNILLKKYYNNIALMGGIGYNLAFSNYGYINIEALYQTGKIGVTNKKYNLYNDIILLNIGVRYLL